VDDGRFVFLNLAMFLQELIKQHRVHRIIADAINLAVPTASLLHPPDTSIEKPLASDKADSYWPVNQPQDYRTQHPQTDGAESER